MSRLVEPTYTTLLDASPGAKLSLTRKILWLYQSTRPTPLVQQSRMNLIAVLQAVITGRFGPGYTVTNFGSTVYGGDTGDSDLDLVVIDSQRPDGFHPRVDLAKLPHIYNVSGLAKCLQRAGFRGVSWIRRTAVPIVKLSLGGIDCDINVNDQLGCINSYMIAHYCELVPLLRPLVFAIKQWARSHGFNNPSGNGGAVTFSSYCLTLMTIGFLQSKSLAPNLQAGLEWNKRMLTRNESHENVFWLRSQTSNERTPCYYGYHLLSSWTPDLDPPAPSVGELLLDWFRLWGFYHHYADDVMSIRQGGVIPRKPTERRSSPDSQLTPPTTPEGPQVSVDMEPTLRVDAPNNDWAKSGLVVVDAFIPGRNCAKNIKLDSLEKFQAECRRFVSGIKQGDSWENLLGDGSLLPHIVKQKKNEKKGTDQVTKGASASAASRATPDNRIGAPGRETTQVLPGSPSLSPEQPAVLVFPATQDVAKSPPEFVGVDVTASPVPGRPAAAVFRHFRETVKDRSVPASLAVPSSVNGPVSTSQRPPVAVSSKIQDVVKKGQKRTSANSSTHSKHPPLVFGSIQAFRSEND